MYSSDLIKRNQAKTQYVEYLRRGVVQSGSGGVHSDSMRLRATTAHVHLTHDERIRIMDDHHHYLHHHHGHHVAVPSVPSVPVMPFSVEIALLSSMPAASDMPEASETPATPATPPDTQLKRRIRTRPAPASKPTLS
jgi:hypothetical protein